MRARDAIFALLGALAGALTVVYLMTAAMDCDVEEDEDTEYLLKAEHV